MLIGCQLYSRNGVDSGHRKRTSALSAGTRVTRLFPSGAFTRAAPWSSVQWPLLPRVPHVLVLSTSHPGANSWHFCRTSEAPVGTNRFLADCAVLVLVRAPMGRRGSVPGLAGRVPGLVTVGIPRGHGQTTLMTCGANREFGASRKIEPLH